jgi:hypothetical protein
MHRLFRFFVPRSTVTTNAQKEPSKPQTTFEEDIEEANQHLKRLGIIESPLSRKDVDVIVASVIRLQEEYGLTVKAEDLRAVLVEFRSCCESTSVVEYPVRRKVLSHYRKFMTALTGVPQPES